MAAIAKTGADPPPSSPGPPASAVEFEPVGLAPGVVGEADGETEPGVDGATVPGVVGEIVPPLRRVTVIRPHMAQFVV